MALDPTEWMPPDGDPDVAEAAAAAYPDDPHAAAAQAWEVYAATLAPAAQVASVSTGAQSVTYAQGASPADAALQRARWHRSRARVKSVQATGTTDRVVYGLHGYTYDDLPYGSARDPEDAGIIETRQV